MQPAISELKEYLDEKVYLYNTPAFIESDPISIPHRFTKKEDIEISGFLAATIAWGNRKMILRNANRIMELLDNSPYDFIMNSCDGDFDSIGHFVHRTFNSADLIYFLKALQNIYRNRGGMESIFAGHQNEASLQPAIHAFYEVFFELDHEKRAERHVADPFKGSAAKKMNMYLRWMVRKDRRGVDFGIWKTIKPAQLLMPLDVHVENYARQLQLIQRKQRDWLTVCELTANLKQIDAKDPVRFDYALFGMGIEKAIV